MNEIGWLPAFASRLESHVWLRRGFFALASIASILLVGYYFGTFDQSIHIPFLKAWADPSLYSTDPFILLRFKQYSFFWFLFIPFLRLGILAPALFCVHLLATYLTFQSVWDLSSTLFEDSMTAMFAVVALVLPRPDLVGFPLIEFSLLNRTFVLPFILIAFNQFFRGQRLKALLLLGVLYNLHVISVNFALVMLLAANLADLSQYEWRNRVRGLTTLVRDYACAILPALPVLTWRFLTGNPLDWSIRPTWLQAVGNGFLHHIFYQGVVAQPYTLMTNLDGLVIMGLFFITQKAHPSPRFARTLRWMIGAALLLLGVQFIASHWLPFTFLMELQLSRVSTLVFIFSILCLSRYIAQLWRSGEIHMPRNAFLTGAFFISVVPVLMPPAWLAGRLVEKQYFGKRDNAYTIAVAALCLIACGLAGPLIGLYYGLWSPGLYIYPRSSTWIDVQLWAQAHTPKEAVFITPPQLIGPFEPDWRVFSERTTLATFTELLEVALDPDYLETWQPRFTAIAPGALEQFDGDYFKNKVRIANAFYSLSEQAILSAACRFGADYLVMEKPHPRAFPIIYENIDFVVYDLRQLKSCSL